MSKRFSLRLDAKLAAYKGSKPKKAKVTPIVSPYANVEGATFDAPFGAGTSGFGETDPATGQKQIVTSMTLAPPLQEAGETATTGLNANLGYLQRTPQEQVDYATGGQDPLYNVLNEQAQKTFNANLGRAKVNAGLAGAANSTAAGAQYAQLQSDKNLLDNQILLQSLGYGNQQATQNANTNLGVIGNLANLVYPLGSAANSQFNTALIDQGRAQAATAQAQNAAEQQYVNTVNQLNANRGSGLGSALGTLAGAAIGSFVPGVGTALGAGLGGAAGSIFGGGGQGVYVPQAFGSSYSVPQSYNLGGIPGYGSLNLSGLGLNSPQFLNLSSPIY